MKAPIQKQKHRLLWPLAGLAALIVIGGSAYAYYHNTHMQNTAKYSRAVRPENSTSYTPSTSQDNTENNERKASTSPASTLDNGPSTTTNSDLSAQIVSASAANGNIHIGTEISGTTTGTCTVTATQGQNTVVIDTVSVMQDVNSYDCGGGAINVSTSSLNPDSGTWQLKLTVTSGNTQATSTSSVTL